MYLHRGWKYALNLFFSLQYSQYDGIGAATPQKSSAPILSTIGGEGRAPIVVEQKNVQGVGEEPVTSAILGKAEPGRDIFAGQPVKEIKSDTLVVDRKQEPAELEKEISSVVAPPATTLESNEQGKEDGHSEKKNSETSPAPSTAQADNKKVETTNVPAAAAAAVPGPLGEAEVEAQKAAEELFPEAA